MNKILDNIENQLVFNMRKNLFHDDTIQSMAFTPEILTTIEHFWEINSDTEKMLIDYLTNRVLQKLCKVNQYYSFDTRSQKELREIYMDLSKNIRNPGANRDLSAKVHYTKLKNWLLNSNSFAEKMYISKEELIEPIVCHEYSAGLQLEILQLDMDLIDSPALDIGCGKQGKLVRHLRANGIEAFGCDRFAETSHFITCSDWFEFEFGIEKWGTIVSNLGFSNHFNHNHLRDDGCYLEYAKTYMDILNSLKIGGSFHYAPNLPFIEKYLEKSKFKLVIQDIGLHKIKSIKIIRLK